MLRPSRFPAKGQRVDFSFDAFRDMIRHGPRTLWEQAAECPCVTRGGSLGLVAFGGAGNSTTGKPRQDCPNCTGRGYTWHSPQEIRAVFIGAESDPKAFTLYGEQIEGMAYFTVNAEHRGTFADKFTLLDSVRLYRETHNYNGEGVSSTRYPVVVRSQDTAPAQSVGVTYCYTADATGLADSVRTENVDFTITVDGKVLWTNPPPENGRYSISYYANPAYLVVKEPNGPRESTTKEKRHDVDSHELPVRHLTKLEFLVTGQNTEA